MNSEEALDEDCKKTLVCAIYQTMHWLKRTILKYINSVSFGVSFNYVIVLQTRV